MRKALAGIAVAAVAAVATMGMSGTAQAIPTKDAEDWIESARRAAPAPVPRKLGRAQAHTFHATQ